MSKRIKSQPSCSKSKKIKPYQQDDKGKRLNIQTNFNEIPIGWNFKYVELENNKFRCTYKDFLRHSNNIINRFEGKSILEISRLTEHSHQWSDITKIDPDLQKIIEQKHLEQDQLYQLQMNSTFRIWGIIRYNIFHIICFDYDHSGYKTKKKHT